MIRNHTSLVDWCDIFPPFLCRIVARRANGQRRLTVREIAAASGLSSSAVAEIAVRTSWRGLSVETVDAFARGCGVDLFRLKRHIDFLRRRKCSHFKRDPRCQRYYSKLMQLKRI